MEESIQYEYPGLDFTVGDGQGYSFDPLSWDVHRMEHFFRSDIPVLHIYGLKSQLRRVQMRFVEYANRDGLDITTRTERSSGRLQQLVIEKE